MTKRMLQQAAPWRQGIAWGLVLIEGIVALGIGIYMLAQPATAQGIVRVLIGIIFLVSGVLRIYAGFRDTARSNPMTPFRLLSGGVGLTVGLLVVLEPFTAFLTEDAARLILAFGLLVYGLIGLVGALLARKGGALAMTIISVLDIVFAILLFYNAKTHAVSIEVFGAIAIIFGLLLVGYALVLRGNRRGRATVGSAG